MMLQVYRLTFGLGEDAEGNSLMDSYALIENARELLIQAGFPGWTEYRGTGVWANPEGRIVTEPSITFTIGSDRPFIALQNVGHSLGRIFQQRTFAYEDRAGMSLIDVIQPYPY